MESDKVCEDSTTKNNPNTSQLTPQPQICPSWLKHLGYFKGQLNSELIYEVIVSPKMQTKNYKDFCPTIQTRIVALFLVIFWWV